MNIALWVVQVLLAAIFLLHARLMLWPPASLQPNLQYMRAVPNGIRQFSGGAEGLGAFGLVLPGLAGTLPWLTPLAAAGLVIVMAGAVVFHIPRNEYPNIAFNLVRRLFRWLVSQLQHEAVGAPCRSL